VPLIQATRETLAQVNLPMLKNTCGQIIRFILGDTGGPLMTLHQSSNDNSLRWFLEGVSTFGFLCSEPGIPGKI